MLSFNAPLVFGTYKANDLAMGWDPARFQVDFQELGGCPLQNG